jgi:hypothetical protein
MIIEHYDVDGVWWSVLRSGNPRRVRFAPIPATINYCEKHDYERAKKLGACDPGTGHDSFLKGITVRVDAYCTQRTHRQLLRYNFIVPVSAMSLEIMAIEALQDDMLTELMSPVIRDTLRVRCELEGRDGILGDIPLNMRMGISFITNYLQLKTILLQREHHKNPEWRAFCEWIMTLPHFKELTGNE